MVPSPAPSCDLILSLGDPFVCDRIQSHIAHSRSRLSSLRTMSATSSSTSAPRVCEGLRDVCDQYDAFLIDQWGGRTEAPL